MKYKVDFYNGHWLVTLYTDLTLEGATQLVKKLVQQFLEDHHPELGRSMSEESWPSRPYQVVISTMTAEAGTVLDIYSVCQQT